MCSFLGRPSLFFQRLCSAWLNSSDFSFRTGSTYADTASALPCRIMTFPLNSIIWMTAHNYAWVHLSRELRSLTSIWTELDSPARLIHFHQPSQSVQTSGESPRASPGLCNPVIGIYSPPTRPSCQPQITSTLQCFVSGAHFCKLILFSAEPQSTWGFGIPKDIIFRT